MCGQPVVLQANATEVPDFQEWKAMTIWKISELNSAE